VNTLRQHPSRQCHRVEQVTDTDRQDREPGAGDRAEGPLGRLKHRYEVWRASIRRRPGVDHAYRIVVGVVGGAIVVGGLALVPLPGPGWLIVFVGLAILATEFVWAERTEKFARRQVSAWTSWLGEQSILVRILLSLLTFAFVLAIVYAMLRYLGVPGWVPDSWTSWLPGLTT
jgi:uncharacterized protein (TIGR02611 family)